MKTYELVIGRTPFEGFGDDKPLIPQFRKVIGGVPDKWVQDALSSGLLTPKINGQISPISWILANYGKDSSAEGFLPLEQQIRDSYFRNGYKRDTFSLSEEELELLGRYLRKMLIIDPKQRATSGDLLAEAWISDAGLVQGFSWRYFVPLFLLPYFSKAASIFSSA